MADMKDDNSTNKTLSAAARRSFFRRRLKHKRSGSKDGKDLMALDAISTDSLPITEGEKSSTEAASMSNLTRQQKYWGVNQNTASVERKIPIYAELSKRR